MTCNVFQREKYNNGEGHLTTVKETQETHASFKVVDEQGQKQYSVGFCASYRPYVWWAQVKCNGDTYYEKHSTSPVDATKQVVGCILSARRSHQQPDFDVSRLYQALNKQMNFELEAATGNRNWSCDVVTTPWSR